MSAPSVPGRCVLVVEENFLTGRLLAESFLATGETCVMARDCDQAIELAIIHKPHLLVLNLNFARPNGVELVRTLRSRGVTVPILGVTLPGQLDLRSAAAAHGVDSFMELPFDPRQVRGRAAWVIGG